MASSTGLRRFQPATIKSVSFCKPAVRTVEVTLSSRAVVAAVVYSHCASPPRDGQAELARGLITWRGGLLVNSDRAERRIRRITRRQDASPPKNSEHLTKLFC